jgi:hypothetical protein
MSTNADRINAVLAESNNDKPKINGKPLRVMSKTKSLEEQLADQEAISAELKKQIEESKLEEKKRQAENQALVKKQKLTNDLMNVLKGHGLDLGDLSSVNMEAMAMPAPPKPREFVNEVVSDEKELHTSKGLWGTFGLLVGLMLLLSGYQYFANLNDSEGRILDAAQAHFWTHVWIALGTILFGFGVQWAVFNKQFRYFSNNIESERSWSSDFDNPTFGGTVRMATTFLTWAFSTWVCGHVMLLILG